MIKLFKPQETVFDHNENIITKVFSAVVKEQGNGEFVLELDCSLEYLDLILKKSIITAPTPRGIQPFRVYSTQKTLTQLKVKARHIFYDTANNFLVDCRPTNSNGQTALQTVMDKRLNASLVKLSSDVARVNTAYYVRKTELEALLGADNSFINNWGGYLIRDGWNAYFRNSTLDRGFKIELSKNLTGIEAVEDDTNLVTKVMPTFVLEDNQVYTLPEVYIASPIASSYPMEIVRELRVELSKEQRLMTAAQLYPFIRSKVQEAWENGLDKPLISYRVNFVLLAKTEAYKHLKLLEQLDIFDQVSCHVPLLDVDILLNVVAYTFDAIKEKFISIDLGDARATGASQAAQSQKRIEQNITREDSPVMIKINDKQKAIADRISGNQGGNIVLRYTDNGKPYELLAMDTDDIATAKEVIRFNKDGLGLSTAGYSGPFNIAMTAKDGLYAQYIYSLKITTAMLEAGAVTAEKMSATDVYSLNGTFDGRIIAKAGTIGNWVISGSNLDVSQPGSRLAISGDPARGYFLYAGSNSSQYNFLVSRDGVLTATGATINGTIRGTNWYINQNGTFSFANGQMTFDGTTLRVPEVQTARELQLYYGGRYDPNHRVSVSSFSGSDFSGSSSGIGLNFSSNGNNAYIGFSGSTFVITINNMKVFESTGAWTRVTTQYAGITVSTAGLWGDYPGGASKIWAKP